MPRLRATPRPRDFQHPRDPIRLLAQAAQPKLRKELREAFRHLRAIVPVTSLAGAIRRGHPRHAAAALIDHWEEVLKGVFNRLGDIRFEAADLGARKISADFKRAGRRVRYVRKAFNPDEPRDEHGEWTSGGGTQEPRVAASATIQTATLRNEWATYGRPLDYEDVWATAAGEKMWNREVQTWNDTHGTNLDAENMKFDASSEAFRAHFDATHLEGRKAPFLGSREANSYYEDAGHLNRAVYTENTIPQELFPDSKRYRHHYKMVKAIGDGFDFDRFDEDTLAALRQAQDDLISDLSEQARDTVAYLIDRGVQAGDSADEIAATIRDTISLTERQAQAVANYRTLLENADQGAIERELRNAEFDDVVQNAIDAGNVLSDTTIDELVADYADNYLDYRADTIARTESLRAANDGLREGYRQAADRGVFPAEAVTRNWLAAIDERTCPICMSIVENNKDGVGLNDDFQSDDGAIDDPPVHANCRCTVEYVTNLDMLPEDSADEEDIAA